MKMEKIILWVVFIVTTISFIGTANLYNHKVNFDDITVIKKELSSMVLKENEVLNIHLTICKNQVCQKADFTELNKDQALQLVSLYESASFFSESLLTEKITRTFMFLLIFFLVLINAYAKPE